MILGSLSKTVASKLANLSLKSKLLLTFYVLLHLIALIVIIYLTPAYLFAELANYAEQLRDYEYGSYILFAAIVLTSFPPLFGYGTCISLCGFAFGLKQGWFIAASGCIVGGTLSFLITRRLMNVFAPLLQHQPLFKALSLAIREKELPLVILIRLCPFPFPYSNLLFASIESVSLVQFFLATLLITPKLILHVWIGSKLYVFADPNERAKMDPNTKWINGASIVASALLGAGTSIYLYRLTMKYVQEVSQGDNELDDLENGLMNDVDEMLEEDDEDNEAATPATAPLLARRPTLPRATSSSPRSSSPASSPSLALPVITTTSSSARTKMKIETRGSEDNWEGFSDFDEEESAVAETPILSAGSSNATVIPDKRRD